VQHYPVSSLGATELTRLRTREQQRKPEEP
jgi:hypothetical protein